MLTGYSATSFPHAATSAHTQRMVSRILALAVALLGTNALACSCRRLIGVFPPSGSQVPTNVSFQVTQNAGALAPMQLFEGQTPVAVDSVVHHAN
jgi:hypothetical protein